jgi:hypothetical protein
VHDKSIRHAGSRGVAVKGQPARKSGLRKVRQGRGASSSYPKVELDQLEASAFSQLGVTVLQFVPLLKQMATAYAESPDAFVARTRYVYVVPEVTEVSV